MDTLPDSPDALLESLRPALLALPLTELRRPTASVFRLVEHLLSACEDGVETSPQDRLLTDLALALAEAERRYVWQPPGVDVDFERVLPRAERAFSEVESAAAALVRRGSVRARELAPERDRGGLARAFRILSLVRVLVHHAAAGEGAAISRRELARARRYALLLVSAREREDLHPLELRDRAYTMLVRVCERTRPTLLREIDETTDARSA